MLVSISKCREGLAAPVARSQATSKALARYRRTHRATPLGSKGALPNGGQRKGLGGLAADATIDRGIFPRARIHTCQSLYIGRFLDGFSGNVY